MSPPPGTLRVMRILVRTALSRIVRSTAIARIRRGGEGRRGKPPRSGLPMLLLILLTIPLFAFQATLTSGLHMRSLAQQVDSARNTDPGATRYRAFRHPPSSDILFEPEEWPSPQREEGFLVALGGLTTLLVVLALAASLGLANEDLGRPEWRFLFLFQFPVATRALVLARILAVSLVQIFCWVVFLPLFAQLFHGAGLGWYSIPLAVLGAFSISLLVASLRVWFETEIRLRLKIQHVRTVQAVCSFVALCGFALIVVVSKQDHDPTAGLLAAVHLPPAAILALPWNWPLTWTRSGPIGTATAFAWIVVALVVCRELTVRRLTRGLVATTGTTSSRRPGTAIWTRPSRLTGVLGKEIRLLLRDRNFMAQTLLAPTFFVVLQVLAQPSMSRMNSSTTTQLAAVFAYGIGAYALSAGCFQVLAGERRALWMLYASPIAIDAALREKSRLWIRIGAIFAIATLAAIGFESSHPPDVLRRVSDAVFALAGIFCAGRIATAIGILGTDLRTEGSTRRVKARFYYVYFFLAGTYISGLASDSIAIRGAVLLGMATLTAGLWDRVRAHIPTLLDPSPHRSSEITLLDGIAAVITLAIMQALAYVVLALVLGRSLSNFESTFVYGVAAIAGLATVYAFRLVFAARGIGLRTLFSPARSSPAVARSLFAGAVCGVALGALGIGYLTLARHLGWIAADASHPSRGELTTLLLAGVLAAPLVEEMIFRGILFTAMSRIVRPSFAAIWSAALFAVCHPQQAWIPVFLVGTAAAVLFRRTNYLPAAMVTHATYNLIIVWNS